MRSKVILFCALLFGSKFVAPIPFDEELGQQRAFQSNSWQENVNTAEQYHGSDFTRAHSVNAMTNSAQQFPTGQEFETNRRRQHGKNYDNYFLHSVNVAPEGTNEQRKDDFVSRIDSFPIRNQHHPIRVDNQFKQQNWQSQNGFENPTMGAIDKIPTAHESPLSVQKQYHNPGQVMQSPPVNRQQYQADNSYPKDLYYHPVPQKSGNIRYVAHNRPSSETRAGPVHYESYHEAHEHNTDIAKSGHNAYVEKVPASSRLHNSYVFENHNQPASKAVNEPGSYIFPPESNNNKNIHVASVNTGFNNFYKRYMRHPIITPPPRYPPINFGHNVQPLYTYRHTESPITHSEPHNHVRDAYRPEVPLGAVLDESGSTKYIRKPIVEKEPNNYAPLNTHNVSPMIQNDSAPSNTASNDNVFLKPTNDEGASDTTADHKKTNIFYDFTDENPNENVYDFQDGENVKEYFLGKIKKNFVIIYANGTVEYVNHLNTGDDPDYILVHNDKPLVPSPHVTSNSLPGSKQSISKILDTLPDKTNYFDSSVTSNENNYNKQPLHVDDAYNSPLASQPLNENHNSNSSSSTVFDDNPSPGSLDNYNPLLGPLTSHGNNYNRDSEPYENRNSPYNSNKNNGVSRWPSKLLTHISPTGTHTSTTPASDDAMIQEFLDSLSIETNKDLLSDSNYYSPQDKTAPNHDSKYPSGHGHTTIPSSQLHTMISPGIFKSTTSALDNLEIQKHQDSHFLITDTSSILPPREYEESLQDTTTQTSSNSDLDNNPNSTPVDEIITKSPIEFVTDNVKDGSSPTPADKEPLEIESVYATEELSNSDNVLTSYDTTTSQPTNLDDLHNTDSIDDVLKQVTNSVEIEKNSNESGNEDTSASSDDTLFVSITRQNSGDTDLITVENDADGQNYFNTDQTNSDEASPTKNLKLDLPNALVLMNGTTDKDYLNQLLSSDSKVNLFIFQMPCQDEAIVEKSKETTIYPNGTCIELLTETRWKNKNDPSPVITTMKKIYDSGKCN
ncbi:unnamed protein product [Arctia plantaginis]|uniref:Uncharacterized protein n=1 Tax=Arctia plantaginis TaxID=874455 RepID=A0A8S1AGT3_ARCPL|nr:unnamed protein product [Arctia plantaginis]